MTQYTTTEAHSPPRNGLGITTLVLGGVAMLFTMFALAAPALTASDPAGIAILMSPVAIGFGIPA